MRTITAERVVGLAKKEERRKNKYCFGARHIDDDDDDDELYMLGLHATPDRGGT